MNLKFIEKYINTIKLKYKSILHASSCSFPLRIIGQELAASNGDVIYTVQIVGKNLVSKIHATEFFNDKQLLNALSPYDLLQFLNISNKQIVDKKDNLIIFPSRARYKIIAKNYDRVIQQTIFTIEISQANKIIHKKFTALEIANNPLVLEKLSSKETYDLGFTVGSEVILKEMQKLSHFRNNQV